MKTGIAALLAASLIGIGGCASQAQLIGAGTGAAVGAAVGGGPMATIGGAMVGYGAGHVYDQKHR
jgi:osmotically inducible lipoprotein OsmB